MEDFYLVKDVIYLLPPHKEVIGIICQFVYECVYKYVCVCVCVCVCV